MALELQGVTRPPRNIRGLPPIACSPCPIYFSHGDVGVPPLVYGGYPLWEHPPRVPQGEQFFEIKCS